MKRDIEYNGVYYKWSEICDKCGIPIPCIMRSTSKPNIEKSDYCVSCVRDIIDNKIKINCTQERDNINKKTVVVSAFPCCGKTYAFNHYQYKYSILDSDSSNFSWVYRARNGKELDDLIKIRNPEFPKNYIKHIKENLGKVDIIFVSSHLQVRQAMEEAGIKYCTVYPKKEMLNEWVGRMYRRGNDANFIKFQIDNWDKFVNSIDLEPHGYKIYRLGNNEYIDVDLLYNDFNNVTTYEFDDEINCESCKYGYFDTVTDDGNHSLCGAVRCYLCAESMGYCDKYEKGDIPAGEERF